MAYARFSNSVWYVYASVTGGLEVWQGYVEASRVNFSNEECLEYLLTPFMETDFEQTYKDDRTEAEFKELREYIRRYLVNCLIDAELFFANEQTKIEEEQLVEENLEENMNNE